MLPREVPSEVGRLRVFLSAWLIVTTLNCALEPANELRVVAERSVRRESRMPAKILARALHTPSGSYYGHPFGLLRRGDSRLDFTEVVGNSGIAPLSEEVAFLSERKVWLRRDAGIRPCHFPVGFEPQGLVSDEGNRLVVSFQRGDPVAPAERSGFGITRDGCQTWTMQTDPTLGLMHMDGRGCVSYTDFDGAMAQTGNLSSSLTELCDGTKRTETFAGSSLALTARGLVVQRSSSAWLRASDGGVLQTLQVPSGREIEASCPLLDGGWDVMFCSAREVNRPVGLDGRAQCIEFRDSEFKRLAVSGRVHCDSEGLTAEVATIVSRLSPEGVKPLSSASPEDRSFRASRSSQGEVAVLFEVTNRLWLRSLLLSPGAEWRFGSFEPPEPNALDLWFPLGRSGVRVLVEFTDDGAAQFRIPGNRDSESFKVALGDSLGPWLLPLRQLPSVTGTLVSELGCTLIIAGAEGSDPRMVRCLPSSAPIGGNGVFRIATDPYDDDTWVVMRTLDQAVLVKNGVETMLPSQGERGVWFVSKGEPFFVGGIQNWLESPRLLNAVRSASQPGAWLEAREGRVELHGRDGTVRLLAADFFVAGMSENHVVGSSNGRLVEVSIP